MAPGRLVRRVRLVLEHSADSASVSEQEAPAPAGWSVGHGESRRGRERGPVLDFHPQQAENQQLRDRATYTRAKRGRASKEAMDSAVHMPPLPLPSILQYCSTFQGAFPSTPFPRRRPSGRSSLADFRLSESGCLILSHCLTAADWAICWPAAARAACRLVGLSDSTPASR